MEKYDVYSSNYHPMFGKRLVLIKEDVDHEEAKKFCQKYANIKIFNKLGESVNILLENS